MKIGEKYILLDNLYASANYSICYNIPIGSKIKVCAYTKPKNIFQSDCSKHGKASMCCKHIVIVYANKKYITHICKSDKSLLKKTFGKINDG